MDGGLTDHIEIWADEIIIRPRGGDLIVVVLVIVEFRTAARNLSLAKRHACVNPCEHFAV